MMSIAPAFLLAMLVGAGTDGKSWSIHAAAEVGAKWGIVTSVHRTPERNRAVGGVPNSFHLSGRAVDIARRPGVRHSEVEAAFKSAGYVLLESLDEGDHSHFAFAVGLVQSKNSKAALHLTSAPETTKPSCSGVLRSLLDLKARRRPDRFEGCGDAPPTPAGLRPLNIAD